MKTIHVGSEVPVLFIPVRLHMGRREWLVGRRSHTPSRVSRRKPCKNPPGKIWAGTTHAILLRARQEYARTALLTGRCR